MKTELSICKLWKFCLVIWLVGVLSQCQSFSKEKKEYPRQIGDIAFDPGVDDPNFELCNEEWVYQYYNFSNGLQFKGEKTAIYRAFSTYQKDSVSNQNGYVTIRFIVNCKGETGRFRMESMNENYEAFRFDRAITQQLMDITQGLSGWEIAIYNDEPKDYYQYLTFKIQMGQIVNILP